MKKKKIIDMDLYYEKLDNGLEIYVIPKNDCNNIYVTYNTKYGGKDNEFIPLNETKMKKFPKGIAHFLEHKLFEEEDNTNVFSFYQERGANANANTSYERTSYLFFGTEYFKENLEMLLHYVESPYFTDENVEKEKGIIEQEYRMNEDNPYSRIFYGALENAFIKLPYNVSILGDLESIRSITKEQLYECYNTFYHPSNMFIVVTGNVNPTEVITIIKDFESKRDLKEEKKIVRKKYKEPDKVAKKEEKVKMNTSISKVCLAYKINKNLFKDIDSKMATRLINHIFDLKVGSTSILSEKLRESDIITSPVSTTVMVTDTHYLVLLLAETKKEKVLIKEITETLSHLSITPLEFERRKRIMISGLISSTENIFRTNDRIIDDITDYNKVYTNELELVKNLSMDDVSYVVSNIDLSNKLIYIIEPK